MRERERCDRTANGKSWPICSVCDGRIHNPECTSRRNYVKDCCEERHRKLNDAGQTYGVSDASQPMYDPSNRTWAD
jgi:hypothetical protein